MMILNNKVVNLSIKPSWVAESSFSFKTNKQTKTKPKENKDIKLWSNVVRFRKCSTNIFKQKYYTPDVISSQIPFICLWVFRLQNRLYFCVFKYARAVKQKVWNEAENRERDWGFSLASQCEARALRARKTLTPRFTDFFTDFEEKTRLFCSLMSIWYG